MPKLLTPQQYEPVLDELNELRPLRIADQIHHKIEIGVCDKLPVAAKKAVTGSLVKGTQQGALLKKAINNNQHYQAISMLLTAINRYGYVPFDQKVSFVLVNVLESENLAFFAWCDSTYIKNIKELSWPKPTFVEFSGTVMYVKTAYDLIGSMTADYYGFY